MCAITPNSAGLSLSKAQPRLDSHHNRGITPAIAVTRSSQTTFHYGRKAQCAARGEPDMIVRIAAIALALVATPLVAESDIVVRGQVLSKEEAAAQAKAYVQSIGIVTTVKPAARWLDRICPKVVGLNEPAVTARVEARLRATASRVGARLANPGCETNLLVAFTADADDMARRINANDPRQMAELGGAWRGRLINGRTPVRWWYSSEVRSADGTPPINAPMPWLSISSEGGAEGGGGSTTNTDVAGDSGGGYTDARRSSLVSTNAKRAIRTATVLVDITLAQGKELDGVTNYAALVGLAEIRFAGDPPPNSILSLFADKDQIYRLTSRDEALLKSLYRLPLDRQGRYHRGWLVNGVAKVLADPR